jgi:hypothetical protein
MQDKPMLSKPEVSGKAQKELDKVEKQFEKFNEDVKNLTQDKMNAAPKQEMTEDREKALHEAKKANEVYLKPKRTISSKEKFNENFREDYNFAKEYVNFVAENKELIGETIDMWTKPFPGIPAEEWGVPTNKPLWGPRYLAEQIKKCSFHRLIMQDRPIGSDHAGAYYGTMVADSTVQRLDAHPVNSRKSVFMGASGF